MHYAQTHFLDATRTDVSTNFSAAQQAQCEREIVFAKVAIRIIISNVLAENMSDVRYPALVRGEIVDVDNINCSRCGLDGCDGNDILFCDRVGCNRAYHQLCLEDPVFDICDAVVPQKSYTNKTVAAARTLSNDPEDSWFCCQCQCVDDMLDSVGELTRNYELVEFDKVFPEVDHLDLRISENNSRKLVLVDRYSGQLVDSQSLKKAEEAKLGSVAGAGAGSVAGGGGGGVAGAGGGGGVAGSGAGAGLMLEESEESDFSLGGEDGVGADDSCTDDDIGQHGVGVGDGDGAERADSPDFWATTIKLQPP